MLDVLLWMCGLWAVLWAVRFFPALNTFLRLRTQQPRFERLEPDAAPEWLRALLQADAGRLRALGFVEVGWVRTPEIERVDPLPSLLLHHAERRSFAMLGANSTPEPWNATVVWFMACLPDGRAIFTMNAIAFAVLGSYRGWTLLDPCAARLEDQWQAHVQALPVLPQELDPPSFLDQWNAVYADYYQSLLRTKVLRRRSDGETELTALGAVAAARAAMRGPRVRARLRMARRDEPATAIPPELDARTFLRFETLRASPSRRMFLLGMFVTTLLASAGALLLHSEPLWVGAVIGVLLLHEAGHWLAMRARGYADATVFFLPLVGAATLGRKDDATLTDEMIVLLAGPIPGLLLGIALFAPVPLPAEAVTLGGLLVLLNLANLAPVYPLDGGRIVHRLFFRHSAWADLAVRALSAAAVFGIFLATRFDPVSLVLALVIGLSIPHGFRLAKLRAGTLADRQATAAAPKDEIAHRVYERIHAAGLGTLPIASRILLARGLRDGWRERPTPTGHVVAWALVYVLGFLGCAVLLAAVLIVRTALGYRLI